MRQRAMRAGPKPLFAPKTAFSTIKSHPTHDGGRIENPGLRPSQVAARPHAERVDESRRSEPAPGQAIELAVQSQTLLDQSGKALAGGALARSSDCARKEWLDGHARELHNWTVRDHWGSCNDRTLSE